MISTVLSVKLLKQLRNKSLIRELNSAIWSARSYYHVECGKAVDKACGNASQLLDRKLAVIYKMLLLGAKLNTDTVVSAIWGSTCL